MRKGRKLKIALVFDDTLDSSDGVAQYVKTLGAWLSSEGHRITYLVGETQMLDWAGDKVYSLAKNYRVRFNGNNLSIPGPANTRRIKEILAKEQFDVLHVQVPYSPFLAARVVSAAPADVAVVGTFHVYPSGWLASLGSRLLRAVLSRSLKRFDKFVSVSQAAAGFAQNTFGVSSVVVPNAVDVAKFRPSDPGVAQANIVFVGRLVKRKGCAQLLEAFKILHQNQPAVKLIVAGTGPRSAKLKRYVVDHDLTSSVEFAGYISEQAKVALLNRAAIACFPSLYGESFGIVLIEAMAAGAGVVLGGDNPGYRSVLGPQPDLLVDASDPRALADRLEQLLANKELATQLHDWQQTTVGQYDISVVGAKLFEAYLAAIDINSASRHNKANEK